MENTAEIQEKQTEPRKKHGFWGWCTALIRWVFILLFAVILLGGLYFKAPWKILVLDGLLLALLTVVPKKKRKYGWLALAAAALAVTVWIFIPEKDSGQWKPYTFDAELAALEAERVVPPENDAGPLYEDLFQRWKQIEENDPFPEEADEEDITGDRSWTAEEFPELAAWFERHEEFFQDLVMATQKPACYFPANVTPYEFSITMGQLGPIKHFAQHLIRHSYLDIGEEKNINRVLEKKLSVLDLGKHFIQQPLLIDLLVGVAIEAMAYDSLKILLLDDASYESISLDDIATIKTTVIAGHFDSQEKWDQVLAYEKLLTKNTFGMLYEVNPEGKTRYARWKSLLDVLNQLIGMDHRLEYSYSHGVFKRITIVALWFSGLPKDPMKISTFIDSKWEARKQNIIEKNTEVPQLDDLFQNQLQFNYKTFLSALIDVSLSTFDRVDIFERHRIHKNGFLLVCDLVIYSKQHGQFPNTLEELWQSEEDNQSALELYRGFVYGKTDDSFKLYHVGQNGIDENGYYQTPKFDPNTVSLESFWDMKPEPDDILIWPEDLEDGN